MGRCRGARLTRTGPLGKASWTGGASVLARHDCIRVCSGRGRRRMMTHMHWRSVFIALLALTFSPTFVAAQTVDPFQWERPNPQGQSVLSRPRPELDPLGIRVGGFRFHPSLSVSGGYEDNVFRSTSNKKDDISLVTSPRLHLESERRNHALEVTADAAIHR
jgi:hypothetical protein